MKTLKLIVKAIGLLFLILTLTIVITYLVVQPDFEIPKTAEQDLSIPHIKLNGHVFHAESFGPESATKVIVIHGGPGQDYRYLESLKALSDSFEVIFYDQRGTGLSPRVNAEELTLETSLDDLHAIIEHYSPNKPVYLIGHSWGAMLASGYIALHPEKVDKAVLAEPGFLTNETAKLFMERTSNMMPPLSISVAWRSLKIWLASTKINTPDDQAGIDYLMQGITGMTSIKDHPMAKYFCNQDMKNAVMPIWRLGMQASINIRKSGVDKDGYFQIDLVSGVENFQKEVLFLVSECNRIIGEDIQQKHMEYYPKARMAIVKNAGHTMIGEKPDTCLTIIRDYFME